MTQHRSDDSVAVQQTATRQFSPRPLVAAVARALPGAILMSAGALLSPAVLATTYPVSNTNDSGSGSLRDALNQANANPGGDTVTFASNVTGSIDLTSGPLLISDSVDVQGPGADILTVDAGGIVVAPAQGGTTQGQPPAPISANVFAIAPPGAATVASIRSGQTSAGTAPPSINVTLSGLTITGGHAAYGAGILANQSNLAVNDCVVSNNTAYSAGGGIMAIGKYNTLDVADSVITGNAVTKYGTSGPPGVGGGVMASTHAATISRSTLSNNTAPAGAGMAAIQAPAYQYGPVGDVTITDSTISGNHAVSSGSQSSYAVGGGLIKIAGNLNIVNSTISDNISDAVAGAIADGAKYDGNTSIRNSTVAGNQAAQNTGGIAVSFYNSASGTHQIVNSVIGGNSAPTDPDLSSIGGAGDIGLAFSLVQNPGSAPISDNGGNIFNQDPMLGTLTNNGGPTLTQLPQAGSPLIDAGDPAFTGPPNNDQRGAGFPRVVNGTVDIGATEASGAAPPVPPFAAVPALGDPGRLGLGALLGLAGLAVARRRKQAGISNSD
ncbi:MAG: choice-of-anchor Q domain-containing protein [Rhodanobacteraceae bacterium]